MVQTDYDHPEMSEITCIKCGAKDKVEAKLLKYRENMGPYECNACKAGAVIGDLDKLKNYMLNSFPGTVNIVDTIIDNLSINYVAILKELDKLGYKSYLAVDDKTTIVIAGPPTVGFNIEQIGKGETPENLAKTIVDKYLN